MRITARQLLGLAVITESGIRLGVVREVELEVESHAVLAYVVGPRWFGEAAHRIAPRQVKEITAAQMVVADSVAREMAPPEFKKRPSPQAALGGVSPSALTQVEYDQPIR